MMGKGTQSKEIPQNGAAGAPLRPQPVLLRGTVVMFGVGEVSD